MKLEATASASEGAATPDSQLTYWSQRFRVISGMAKNCRPTPGACVEPGGTLRDTKALAKSAPSGSWITTRTRKRSRGGRSVARKMPWRLTSME